MRRCLPMGLTLCAVVWSPATPADDTAMALSFAYEPRLGTYAALDDALLDYGFTPVGGGLLPAWGLRGRAFFAGGSFLQLSMTAGLRSSEGDPIPTVSTLTESTAGTGYRHRSGAMASMDLGFSVLTQSVASELEGGALVYMGPVAHPRIGWSRQLSGPVGPFLAVVLGGSLQLPVGDPHRNPLWEEPFDRKLVGAVTLGIESGLGLQRGGE